MPRFNCPHCGTVLKASDEKVGSFFCPRCERRVRVAGDEQPDGADDAESTAPPAPRRRRRPVRRPRAGGGAVPWIIAGVVASVLAVGLCCGVAGWVWHRQARNLDQLLEADQKARTVTVRAEDILREFQDGPVAADMKYEDKYLQVTGVVEQTGLDPDGVPFVILRGDGAQPGLRLKCVFDLFDDRDEAQVMRLQKGQTVTIRGEYDGHSAPFVEMCDCVLGR